MICDISVVRQMSSQNRLVWMPTGEHTNRLAQIRSPLLVTALWAYWWLTNSAQRFSTYWALSRAISIIAYQTVCHKPVYHPFSKFRIYAHVSVCSLVGWTTASNSRQNYSRHVFWDQYSHVGLEVQLLTLKASLHVHLKRYSQKATSAWRDHVSFYSQWRSDSNGEPGDPEQKPNFTILVALSLYLLLPREPLQIPPPLMLPTPKTLLWIS